MQFGWDKDYYAWIVVFVGLFNSSNRQDVSEAPPAAPYAEIFWRVFRRRGRCHRTSVFTSATWK